MGGNFKNRKRSRPPAERLERSHRRLEERLEELAQSALALAVKPSSSTAWACVEDVLVFLEDNGMRHEEDEEKSVFPRLAAQPGLRLLLSRLRAEHRLQRKLVSSLAKIVANRKAAGAAGKVSAISSRLQESYLAHIQCEDEELLPAMSRYMDSEQEAEMTAEMAARRG